LNKEWMALPAVGRASATATGRSGTVPVGTCPDCEAEVHVDLDADKGDTVTCDECGSQLEIVGLDPVELDIAEEDLDEDDYGDEDDEEF
jgi:alpha-aminoadipate carrier protein LysW